MAINFGAARPGFFGVLVEPLAVATDSLLDRGLLADADHASSVPSVLVLLAPCRAAGRGLCDRRVHARDAALQRVAHDRRRAGSSAVTVPDRATSTSRCRSPSCRSGSSFRAHRRSSPRSAVSFVRMTMAQRRSHSSAPRERPTGSAASGRGDVHRHGFTRLGVGHGSIAITPFLVVVCAAAAAAVLAAPLEGVDHLGVAVRNHSRPPGHRSGSPAGTSRATRMPSRTWAGLRPSLSPASPVLTASRASDGGPLRVAAQPGSRRLGGRRRRPA